MAFGGVLLVVIGQQQSGAPSSNYLLGVGLALAAAFFYAMAAAITKPLKAVPPRVIVLIQMIVGALLLMPFATWPSGASKAQAWGFLLAIGFIHTGLMSTLLYGAIQKYRPHWSVCSRSFIRLLPSRSMRGHSVIDCASCG